MKATILLTPVSTAIFITINYFRLRFPFPLQVELLYLVYIAGQTLHSVAAAYRTSPWFLVYMSYDTDCLVPN